MNDVRANHFRMLNQKPMPVIGERWEINEAIYNEFLGMSCPPLGWTKDSFYESEFQSHEVTNRYTREGDRYFCEFAVFPGGLEAANKELYPEWKSAPWGTAA